MKTAVFITSTDENISYLRSCLEHLMLSRTLEGSVIDVCIIDFGPGFEIRRMLNIFPFQISHILRSEQSFTSNINAAIRYAIGGKYNFFVYMNDDVYIGGDFFKNAFLSLSYHPKAGFMGSTYNQDGWLTPLNQIKIPEPKNEFTQLKNIARLHWEFSCFIARVEAIEQTGLMDEDIGGRTGYMSDNDYLLRMRKAGWETWRSGLMTAGHSKGVSQIKHRYPGKNDAIRYDALSYLYRKWGTDLSNIDAYIEDTVYEEPFNGEEQ